MQRYNRSFALDTSIKFLVCFQLGGSTDPEERRHRRRRNPDPRVDVLRLHRLLLPLLVPIQRSQVIRKG